ncbi:MAG TPA: c-type cytochrome [Actinomycetota bacterium]|jgi:ubiquinol-cytochrome c reductase cytochrome c subunit|nr:c-type cytochrome [Actinomycetota bacterium]
MKRARICFAALPLLFLASCGYFDREPAPYRPPQEAVSERDDLGASIYKRDCAWCHGDSGRGTGYGPEIHSGQNGPALADFVLRTGRMPLRSPNEQMRRRPPFYTQEEIDAVVDYVSTFAPDGPAIPSPRPEEADLARGAELYLSNCAACHSTTGIGGALTQGSFPGPIRRRTGVIAPDLTASSAIEIAEATRTGPGAMPVFNRGVLSDREVDAIVRYVQYLQDPDDSGGAAIGRVGPVAEGAVGWIIGLGLLLGVSVWIGSRTHR